MKSASFTLAALAAAAGLAGCGGSGTKYKIDDVSLAQVPVGEKQAIFTAQNEIAVARSEEAKAQSDLRATEDELGIAGKEKEQARLEVQKAKLERDAADRLKDQGRLSTADRAVKVAEVGERAAAAKVDWIDAKRGWHRKVLRLAESHEELALSKTELEKAKLADQKGIKPTPDFNLSNFTTEYASRERRWFEARTDADKAKVEMDKQAQTFNDLQSQYAQMRGSAPAPSTGMPGSR